MRNHGHTLIVIIILLAAGSSVFAFRGGHMRGGRHGGGFGHHGGGHSGGFGHHGHHGGGHHHQSHHHAAHHHARHHDMHHAWHVHHAIRLTTHIIFGAYLLSRPQHTTVVYVNSAPYYYTDGVYYVKKSDTTYVTVPPPEGAEIKSLPNGTVNVQFKGTTYSYYQGSFYVESGDEYQVVTAPVGATVTYTAKGARKTTVNGTAYYVYGGVYYKPKFVDGLTLYTVSANPTAKTATAKILAEPPEGNITVKHGGKHYYYVDGKWYVEVEGGCEETAAPSGASVPYLPDNAKKDGDKFVVGTTTYETYQKDGVTLYRVA